MALELSRLDRRLTSQFLLVFLAFIFWVTSVHAIDRTVNNIRVSSDQVAAAIAASPNASTQLQNYASAIGSLAMFESEGQLSVYNGSCCYGVLQMTGTNIRNTLGIGAEEFRRLPLQQQVNAWSTVMSQALSTYAPRTLASMVTFDGRSVTPSMVLACVQLGVGNCMTMIRSGRCNGFEDINGTSICDMADRIDGTTTPTTSGTAPTTGGPTGSPVSTPLTPTTVINNCITDGYGHCLSMSAAMEQGFLNGSGHSMADLRDLIQSLTVGITLLICAWLVSGLWREYTTGRASTADVIMGARSVFMIVAMILVVMTVV
ncbi:MAG: hypothetical protein CVU21_03920 [Betaproteobacteria bacterium HGW-Betaproteobacteria-15]|nr:MAG: hypothetical protein CVU21_03920 [Betaproteobacteria bacterium HGW-Betaproteobacteria-15]